jgi:hypothetical protein
MSLTHHKKRTGKRRTELSRRNLLKSSHLEDLRDGRIILKCPRKMGSEDINNIF